MIERDSTIDVARCLCNYMIVLLHTSVIGQFLEPGSIAHEFLEWFCGVAMRIALPTLFLISGYLMFINYKLWDGYKRKLWNRGKRLFVPYVLWNMLYVAYFLALSPFFTRMQDRVDSFGLNTFSGAFSKVLSLTVHPMNGPLWFIRFLLVLAFLSPIIWAAYKPLRGYFALVLSVVWIVYACHSDMDKDLSVLYPSYAIFMYVLGGFLAVKGIKLASFVTKYRFLMIAFALLGILACSFVANSESRLGRMVGTCGLMLTSFVIIVLASVIYHRVISSGFYKLLQDASFFVYAAHFLFCSSIMYFIAPHLCMLGNFPKLVVLFIFYFGAGIIAMLIVYRLGRKLLGRSMAFLDGTL